MRRPPRLGTCSRSASTPSTPIGDAAAAAWERSRSRARGARRLPSAGRPGSRRRPRKPALGRSQEMRRPSARSRRPSAPQRAASFPACCRGCQARRRHLRLPGRLLHRRHRLLDLPGPRRRRAVAATRRPLPVCSRKRSLAWSPRHLRECSPRRSLACSRKPHPGPHRSLWGHARRLSAPEPGFDYHWHGAFWCRRRHRLHQGHRRLAWSRHRRPRAMRMRPSTTHLPRSPRPM
mmetsp:Transcript_102022/g.295223  ORF Transcript_102022/g.295223 Transcript_102022/m.295223 type:complete len:234 (+) Transcript_102022:155-856(+)